MSAWDFEAGPREGTKREDGTIEGQAKRRKRAREARPKQHGTGRRRQQLSVTGPRQLDPGQIVKGIVAAASEDGVLVDVGGKSEGLIPIYEFPDRSELPAVDDEIEVAVVRMEEDDETLVLSKTRADYERVWNRILSAAETGDILDAMVVERVKGGLRVDLGVAGFVPASHVATRDVRNLDRFVGRSLRLKVLETDRERKKVVLSHRLVVEEEKRRRRDETLARLEEGLVCEGKVRNLTDYGAFIDLGGVDGLLHISEMSWGRIEHPSEVCKVGDTVRVMVLDVDRERNRISLGRRQILPDPWKEAADQIKPGSLVKAKITRAVRTGAFAELESPQLEGFIPLSELSERRIRQASDVVQEGDEVTLKVLKINARARRMTLSVRGAEQEKERQEYREYIAGQETAKVTLGDQFADVLGVVVEQVEEVGEEAPEEVPAAEAPSSAQEEEVAVEPQTEEGPEPAQVKEAEGEAEETEKEETTEAVISKPAEPESQSSDE